GQAHQRARVSQSSGVSRQRSACCRGAARQRIARGALKSASRTLDVPAKILVSLEPGRPLRPSSRQLTVDGRRGCSDGDGQFHPIHHRHHEVSDDQ
nr:hypothetical protein [Tanacetum cinerariifolium]